MSKVVVKYLIDGTPHSVQFDSIDEADAFVMSLLETYGHDTICDLNIEIQ